MTIHTKSRHRTKAGGNVFLDLGFSPWEAKRLLALSDAQIDESIRLKQITQADCAAVAETLLPGFRRSRVK